MTTTQVQYWSYKEQGRHNRATERLGTDELKETTRHNKQTEKLGTNTLKETKRHNKATERLGTNSLKETKRHNVQTEKETKRSNMRRESLTAEGNAIAREKNKIAWFDAKTRRAQSEANIQKILKESSMSDAYHLLASRNKKAQTVGAVAVLTEMVADPSQSPNTRKAARELLDELNDWSNKITNTEGGFSNAVGGYFDKVYTTGDGRKIKLTYKGGSWFFVPVSK